MFRICRKARYISAAGFPLQRKVCCAGLLPFPPYRKVCCTRVWGFPLCRKDCCTGAWSFPEIWQHCHHFVLKTSCIGCASSLVGLPKIRKNIAELVKYQLKVFIVFKDFLWMGCISEKNEGWNGWVGRFFCYFSGEMDDNLDIKLSGIGDICILLLYIYELRAILPTQQLWIKKSQIFLLTNLETQP